MPVCGRYGRAVWLDGHLEHTRLWAMGYGRGAGVGRGLATGANLGVGVGLGVDVAVGVAVGVGGTLGVGVGPPVTSRNAALIGPQV